MSPTNAPKSDKDQPADGVSPSGKKQDYHTNMPVGEILRRAREHFGQSLADVEAAIRIRGSQIDAIEKSQYDKLPGRVYAIGFVRSYSEYLGFDGDKMIALFKSQSTGGGRIKPELNFPAPASESRLPPVGLVVAGLALFIAFMIVWASGNGPAPDKTPAIPPVSVVTQPVAAPSSPSGPTEPPASPLNPDLTAPPPGKEAATLSPIPMKAGADMVKPEASPENLPEGINPPDEEEGGASVPEAAQVQASAPAAKEKSADPAPNATEPPVPPSAPANDAQDGITLNVRENSWVEIKDESGKAIVSRMLKTGDQYFVPNRPDLVMSLGNAGGIDVTMDGKPLPPLGKKGEVRRNISLDIKALKALAAGRE